MSPAYIYINLQWHSKA